MDMNRPDFNMRNLALTGCLMMIGTVILNLAMVAGLVYVVVLVLRGTGVIH